MRYGAHKKQIYANQMGCVLSHAKAIEEAKRSGLDYVLLFEDDAIPIEGFKRKLRNAMAALPYEWDALWLAGSEEKSAPYNATLKKAVKTWGTYAYVVHSRFFDEAIKGLRELQYTADGWYTQIQRQHRIYSTVIPLAKHEGGVSEIEMRDVGHKYNHLK